MSLIQKFSIKRINKIRKILLLYIDKDLKLQKKYKKQFDYFTREFYDKSLEKCDSITIKRNLVIELIYRRYSLLIHQLVP